MRELGIEMGASITCCDAAVRLYNDYLIKTGSSKGSDDLAIACLILSSKFFDVEPSVSEDDIESLTELNKFDVLVSMIKIINKCPDLNNYYK